MLHMVICKRVTGVFLLLSSLVCQAGQSVNDGIGKYEAADYGGAYKILLPHAEKGSVVAQRIVGRIYLNGLVSEINVSKGIFWLEKAAAQGDGFSIERLGLMYASGKKVKRDCGKALGYLLKRERMGADRRHGAGSLKFVIGQLYATVCSKHAKDSGEGIRWIRRAASENLDGSAMLFLYKSYLDGKGVPQDRAEAVMWLLLESKLGKKFSRRGRLEKEVDWLVKVKKVRVSEISLAYHRIGAWSRSIRAKQKRARPVQKKSLSKENDQADEDEDEGE